jgi:hypothetical protein
VNLGQGMKYVGCSEVRGLKLSNRKWIKQELEAMWIDGLAMNL